MHFPTALRCHMIETPQVVETPAQLVATIHIETPRSGIQHVMGAGIGEAMAAVKAQGIGPAGPWFAHHLKMTPSAACILGSVLRSRWCALSITAPTRG